MRMLVFALGIAVGGQGGARLGALILRRLPAQGLRLAFIALLLYAAARNAGLLGELPAAAPGSSPVLSGWTVLLVLGLGAAAGVCAVLFGVGGGVVVVPGLVLLVQGFPLRDAMATSLLAMIPTAAMGLVIAAREQRVERGVLPRLVVPARRPAVRRGGPVPEGVVVRCVFSRTQQTNSTATYANAPTLQPPPPPPPPPRRRRQCPLLTCPT